ncbi:hypothetical protein GRJ2_001698700 [Grus japonensis]|uniref:Uncharacterized protein n=1 Tax=Grus japonensis TaxID=30415 RepID=A0ABC9X433_GRUJA
MLVALIGVKSFWRVGEKGLSRTGEKQVDVYADVRSEVGKWILLCEGIEETVPSYREEERPVGNIQVPYCLTPGGTSAHLCGHSNTDVG